MFIHNIHMLNFSQLPYFLEILLHLKIPSSSKSCRIFQLAYPNKCHPRNLAAWYVVDNDLRYAHAHYTHIQIGLYLKLCMRVRVNLCRRCPRIIPAWYSTLKLNLAAARFRRNIMVCHYDMDNKMM